MSLTKDIDIKGLEKGVIWNYTPTADEKKILDYVRNRVVSMKAWRTAVDKDWSIYQKMIEARHQPYPDERSSSTVPLASALTELYVAEAIKIRTDFRFKWEWENKIRAQAFEHVWKYDWRVNKRQFWLDESEYTVAMFGTTVLYTWYEKNTYTQKDPTIWDDLIWKFTEKTIVDENIILKEIDLRYVWFDNHCWWYIEDASDACYEQWISKEQFDLLKWNKLYNNLDKVGVVWFSNDTYTFLVDEEKIREWDFVKFTHYWNKDKDMYVCYANDLVMVRCHPLFSTINWKKALPLVIRWLGKKKFSLYHRGICEACMMFNSEINDLRELCMDAIRRSNTQTLAIGNWLSFTNRQFSYDNEILLFDWQFNNNFQQISWNPPNQAIFNYIDRIYKDIAVYIWIDIQNLIGQPQQTAFQTEVQREASQKRVNVWLKNRDYAYERLADLHKDNLLRFFPIKTAKWLYPKIEIEWEKFEWGKFKKTKKNQVSMFEVTPEVLRGEDMIFVDVYTDTTLPTIDVVQKSLTMDMLTTVGNMATSIANAKSAWVEIEDYIPVKDILEKTIEWYNLNVGSKWGDSDDIKKKAKLFTEDLIKMKDRSLSNINNQWQTMWPLQKNNLMPWEGTKIPEWMM